MSSGACGLHMHIRMLCMGHTATQASVRHSSGHALCSPVTALLPALPLLWLRPGQRKLLLPRRRLLFNVVSAMPRLEVELQGMPKDMYQGEVVACTALLRNRGSLALRNLQLVLSGPQVSASDSVDCCWQRLRYGCKCRKCGCLQTSGHADVVNEQIQQ